jgi:hypothetical protein
MSPSKVLNDRSVYDELAENREKLCGIWKGRKGRQQYKQRPTAV